MALPLNTLKNTSIMLNKALMLLSGEGPMDKLLDIFGMVVGVGIFGTHEVVIRYAWRLKFKILEIEILSMTLTGCLEELMAFEPFSDGTLPHS